MFRSKAAKQLSEAPKLTIRNNPYKARKLWPPDFSKLHPRYQFRLERKFRRRAKLRYQRPGWVRGVTLAANGSTFVILVYGVLFLDWKGMTGPNGETPFDGIRAWFHGMLGSIWSVGSPPLRRPGGQEGEAPPKPSS